jgi:hypothetical protein
MGTVLTVKCKSQVHTPNSIYRIYHDVIIVNLIAHMVDCLKTNDNRELCLLSNVSYICWHREIGIFGLRTDAINLKFQYVLHVTFPINLCDS